MTSQQIPQRLDPFKYIGGGLELAGSVALERLTRLDDLLANKQGNVQISIRFSRDEQKFAVVSGEIETEVNLVCQRCRAVDTISIASEFRFALLRKEADIQSLPESYEPMLLDKPELDIYELIEEELILALPIVHYHEEGNCSEALQKSFGKDVNVEEKPNPFSVLEKLKN